MHDREAFLKTTKQLSARNLYYLYFEHKMTSSKMYFLRENMET